MLEVYYYNVKTNQHVSEIIQKSNLTNVEFKNNKNVNIKTIKR